MKRTIILFWILFLIPISLAFNTGSNNYSSNLTIISPGGNNNLSSANYTTQIVVSQSVVGSSVSNTENYGSCFGFFCMFKTLTARFYPPIPGPLIGGSASGGIGSGSLLPRFEFEVTSTIKTTLTVGEMQEEVLRIVNTGNQEMQFTIVNHLPEFIFITETEFTLAPGQARDIVISIFSQENEIPGVYTDYIEIKTEQVTKKVGIILEIKDKEALFDINLKITQGSKKIAPGMKILGNIEMLNLGELKNIDVILEYWIQDFENNIIDYKKETLAINQRLLLTKSFKLPKEILEGSYSFNAKITYDKDNKEAVTSEVFEVVNEISLFSRSLNFLENYYIWFVIALLTMLVLYKQVKIIKEIKRL